MGIERTALQTLRNRVAKFILDHGLPKNQKTLEWVLMLNKRETTPEEAFAPLYEAYFSGTASFPIEYWEEITIRLDEASISLTPSGESIYFSFEWEFDTGDGGSPGQGHRTARGII